MKTCNYCGSDDIEKFMNIKDRFSNEIFQYNNCSSCGLIFLEKILSETEILNYYPEFYEAYNVVGDQKLLEKKLQFIFSFCKKCSSILDVGCASGNFLKVAKKNGFRDVFGVELNSSMREIASHKGIEIIGSTLTDAYRTGRTFDVITLWDVFEHLPDPITSLELIFSMLNQNGLLFISIPNLNSFDRFLFGKSWIGWDAPRHFFLFDQKLLKELLNKCGFDYIGAHGVTGAKGAFNLSIDKYLNREISKTKLFSLFSLMLWPYRQIGYIFKRCPVITVVARKRSL